MTPATLLLGFWRPITAIREADTDGNPFGLFSITVLQMMNGERHL